MTARGVFPFVMEFSDTPNKTIEAALQILRARDLIISGDPIVILSDVLHDELIVDSILLRDA